MSKEQIETLKELPFQNMIGGPLEAVVKAQYRSAMTTLAFIKSDAIMDEQGHCHEVTFRYRKQSEVGGEIKDNEMEMAVPILAILPIPNLRIDLVTIKFHAELTDSFKDNVIDNGPKTYLWYTPGQGFMAKFSNSEKRDTHTEKIEKYTLDVEVRASQAPMPAGLDRVLTMLEHSIKERPAGGPK